MWVSAVTSIIINRLCVIAQPRDCVCIVAKLEEDTSSWRIYLTDNAIGDYNTFGTDEEQYLDDYKDVFESLLGVQVSKTGEFKKVNMFSVGRRFLLIFITSGKKQASPEFYYQAGRSAFRF